jgi:MOSC domain-containing protein YiiM
MDAVQIATLVAGRGIAGNADRGGKRQVTVISQERWAELMAALGAQISPSARRANLMLSGIDLRESRGKLLRVGACEILVRGETRPCERMDEALPGLRAAMQAEWGGGAFGEVTRGGEIAVGDEVEWVLTPATAPAPGSPRSSA